MANRRTLAREVFAEGVALHAGVPARMRLLPAAPGSGISFRRADRPGSGTIPALWRHVVETRLGTVLEGPDGSRAGVAEHLLAALSGAEIDDCVIELGGPEPPALGGDALSFLALLDEAGARESESPREIIRVRREVSFGAGESAVRLLPAPSRVFFVEIEFETRAIGRQSLEWLFTPESFRKEIAPARTFGFRHQADELRRRGYGLGADLENTLVIDGDRLMNPEVLRFSDEFVRHKILDAVGDLALAGAPLIGRFEGRRPSHALNIGLMRAVFADPENYERIPG